MRNLLESLLDDIEDTLSKGDTYIKSQKSLDAVKKHYNKIKNLTSSQIKFNEQLDAVGNKLEIGDLVMFPYKINGGGNDELYQYLVGVIIDFSMTTYGNYVKLNINGNTKTPATVSVYNGCVIKTTPHIIKNLYKM